MLQREQLLLNRKLRQIFTRVDQSFAVVAQEISATAKTSQRRIAEGGQAYTGKLLGPVAANVGTVTPAPLVGVTGFGVQIEEVFAGSRLMTTNESLRTGMMWGLQVAKMALADTARQSIFLGMGTRHSEGYVRALVGKTCSRCAVLAGKHYHSREPFLRHPNCDCIHVPYRSDQDASPAVNANEYFESLGEAEQDAAFTKAGAEAIRGGADINQVVNARRGMSTVADSLGRNRLATQRVFGQDLFLTSEGMTKRGFAKNRLRTYPGGAKAPRLMPESISKIAAGDQQKYLMLLHRNGYIL